MTAVRTGIMGANVVMIDVGPSPGGGQTHVVGSTIAAATTTGGGTTIHETTGVVMGCNLRISSVSYSAAADKV